MPANLTPEYEKAEQRFREAADDAERLEALREMLRTIPKHKGTDKMQADIKRRISQLRKQAGRKGAARSVDPFHVPKSGSGQVVLVGTPNVGKSAITAAVTNAPVKVADYPYATALPTPGMLEFEDVQIQLVDTPPMTAEHVPGGLIGTIRLADVIAVVVDLATEPLEQLEAVLNILAGRNIVPVTRPRDELDADNPGEHCGIVVANRLDLAEGGSLDALRGLYAERIEIVPVSATTGEGIDLLCRRLWELLALIRVYTKQPGKPLDKDRPYTLPIGATVEALAAEIHRELPQKMKYARIWGHGRHDGQQVHRTETLQDKDVVEVHE